MGKKYKFNSLEDCLKQISNDLIDSTSDISTLGKQSYKKKAEESYDWYDPMHPEYSRYRSGRPNSFAEESNIDSMVVTNGNETEVRIFDNATSDCNCTYCAGKDLFLDTFIEEGVAGVETITEKPVAEETLKDMKSKNKIEKILDKHLK